MTDPTSPAGPGGPDGPDGPDGWPAAGPRIEPWLREILRCPVCHSELRDAVGPTHPELQCTDETCGRAYRIDDGVPVLLPDEARLTRG